MEQVIFQNDTLSVLLIILALCVSSFSEARARLVTAALATILRPIQELIPDGLLCFNGALTLIDLVAVTSKNFSQGDIPSFKLLDYLALAVGFSTILRRA